MNRPTVISIISIVILNINIVTLVIVNLLYV